jgi:hypothetical protein
MDGWGGWVGSRKDGWEDGGGWVGSSGGWIDRKIGG